MKTRIYLGVMVLLICFMLSGCSISELGKSVNKSQSEGVTKEPNKEKIDSFLSRISQSDIRSYDSSQGEDIQALIHFGIWDNYLADFDTISPDREGQGFYMVHSDEVAESIKQFFGINFSDHGDTQSHTYEDGFYIFSGENSGPTLHVKSDTIENIGEGTYKVKGKLYNVYNNEQNYGNMEAIVKDKEGGGYILTFYNEERRQ